MRKLIISVAVLTFSLFAFSSSAKDNNNEQLYQVFMAYAQEHRLDAQKHERLAELFHKMAKQKEIMAEGYRNSDEQKVGRAVHEYYRLQDLVDSIHQ